MRVTAKLVPFMLTTQLSWPGKLRLTSDLFIPRIRHNEDESLATFFRRRLGKEALDRIIEPLLTGIYPGAADQLSLLATFPRFREMEREHGSLLRALLVSKWKAPKEEEAVPSATPFVTLREGLGHLVDVLAERLESTTVCVEAS